MGCMDASYLRASIQAIVSVQLTVRTFMIAGIRKTILLHYATRTDDFIQTKPISYWFSLEESECALLDSRCGKICDYLSPHLCTLQFSALSLFGNYSNDQLIQIPEVEELAIGYGSSKDIEVGRSFVHPHNSVPILGFGNVSL